MSMSRRQILKLFVQIRICPELQLFALFWAENVLNLKQFNDFINALKKGKHIARSCYLFLYCLDFAWESILYIFCRFLSFANLPSDVLKSEKKWQKTWKKWLFFIFALIWSPQISWFWKMKKSDSASIMICSEGVGERNKRREHFFVM